MPIQEARPSGTASIAASQLAQVTAPAAATIVNIRAMRFEVPEGLTIAPGTSIEFVNQDRMPHTVTATGRNAQGNGPLFDLTIPPGQRGRLTFTASQVGTHLFFCKFHPAMTGRLVVQAPATDALDRVDSRPPSSSTPDVPDLASGLAAPKAHLAGCGRRGC